MLIQSYYNIEYILYDFLVSKTLFKSIFSDMQVGNYRIRIASRKRTDRVLWNVTASECREDMSQASAKDITARVLRSDSGRPEGVCANRAARHD